MINQIKKALEVTINFISNLQQTVAAIYRVPPGTSGRERWVTFRHTVRTLGAFGACEQTGERVADNVCKECQDAPERRHSSPELDRSARKKDCPRTKDQGEPIKAAHKIENRAETQMKQITLGFSMPVCSTKQGLRARMCVLNHGTAHIFALPRGTHWVSL